MNIFNIIRQYKGYKHQCGGCIFAFFDDARDAKMCSHELLLNGIDNFLCGTQLLIYI